MNKIFSDWYDRLMAYISLFVVPYGAYLAYLQFNSGESTTGLFILLAVLLSASNYWWKIVKFFMEKNVAAKEE